MKISKFFLMALVAVFMFSSCQDDSTEPAVLDAKKSVAITIENLAKAPQTRVPQAGFTPEDVPVAKVSELNVLFADADGDVIETRSLADAEVSGSIYTFHGVSVSVDQIAVTNIDVDGNLDNYQDAIDELSIEDYQGGYVAATTDPVAPASMHSVPVYDSDVLTDDGTCTHEGVVYPLWAASVEVVPALARIEIGGITCTDLNAENANARFATLSISRIGIHNTVVTTIGDDEAVLEYPATAAGQTAFETATTWNVENFTAFTLNGTGAEGTSDTYDGVFAYNIVPGNVPNIILKVSGATKNLNNTGNFVFTDPSYVKTNGLKDGETPIETIAPGHIYQVNFAFASENVKPWNGPELVCVDVTVTIPNWVIENNLTPTFN